MPSPRTPTSVKRRSLRADLLNAQYDLKLDGRFPVLILIAGVEGAGKGETVNLLNEWMDPRHIQTTAFGDAIGRRGRTPRATGASGARCRPRGSMGIFFGAWHTQPIVQRVMGQIGEGAFAGATAEIQRLEKMLCDEGVLLLKYWFHLSKEQQKQAPEGAGEGPRDALARHRHRVGLLQALRPISSSRLRTLRTPDLHGPGTLDRGAGVPTPTTARWPWAATCWPRCASAWPTSPRKAHAHEGTSAAAAGAGRPR